jgi:hypothetical protein
VSPAARVTISKEVVAAQGDSFTVSGSGFVANEPITLTIQINPNLKILLGGARGAQVTANEAGAFMVDFDEIGVIRANLDQAMGVRSLSAVGLVGSAASAPVNIVDAAAEAAPAVDTSLAAGAAVVGDRIMIWGAGFNGGEAVVMLAIGVSDGADRIVASAMANDSGAFSTDATNTLDAGTYTLQAVGSDNSTATAPLVILESK